MDASSTFGQSSVFGQPSTDLNMNEYYLQQAIQHSMSQPSPAAQAQVAYWQQVVTAARAAQAAQAAAAHAAAAFPQPTGQPMPGPLQMGQPQMQGLPMPAPMPPASIMTPGVPGTPSFHQACSMGVDIVQTFANSGRR